MKEETVQPKISKWKRGWLITKSAWHVLKLDKELLVIPLISSLIGIVVIVVGFGGGILLSPDTFHHTGWNWSYDSQKTYSHATYAAWLATSAVLALLSSYTVGAMIAMALKRLRGGDPVLRDGLNAVKGHFGDLSVFTLLSFGIITILQRLEAILPFAGKLLAFLGEITWRVAGFFAIPIIVDADKFVGPIDATKQSVGLIKKTWRESGVSQFTMGSIFLVIVLLELFIGVGVTVMSALTLGGALAVVPGTLTVLALILTILVSSAMEGIAKAVLYYYAVTGEVPESFDKRLLREAFTPKKARRVFGR